METHSQAPAITFSTEDVCASAIAKINAGKKGELKTTENGFSYKCLLGTFYFMIVGAYCLIMNYDSSLHSSFHFAS